MRQQPYFIKPVNHLSYRNQSSKQSFSQQQNNDDSKSRSQNRLSNLKKPSPLITQVVTTPQLKRVNNQQFKYLIRLRILKSNKIDLPSIPSPKCDSSLSKFKSFENLNNLNIQARQPTPRRFKSDEQNISEIGTQPQKVLRSSQHITNVRLRNDSGKSRNRSNHTPLIKTKTEPSEIINSPIVQRKKRDFDDSRELLYQLQRGYSKDKQQIMRTEPDDPYRIGSICENRNCGSIINKNTQSINEYQRFTTKNFIEIPCDDEYSQFFREDEMQSNFKNTQKHNPQISQQTKEKILDLLFLSTGELKKKFSEQNNRIQQSKITNRLTQNKPIVSKCRFPNDFFNVLHTNDSQLI